MNDEVEYQIRELFSLLYLKKGVILGITSFFLVVAFTTLQFLKKEYRSDVLLAPVSAEKNSGLSSLANKIGGIASLAGTDLGDAKGIDKTTMALEIMRSRRFTIWFLNKYNLKRYLLLNGEWDNDKREWSFDGQTEISEGDLKPYQVMALDVQAYNNFQDGLDIIVDKSSGIVTISYLNESPVFAKQWLSLYIKEINEYMLRMDISEAEESIEFLTNRLSSTSLNDLRQIFYGLIAEQTKTIMLANSRKEYVLKVLDPPLEANYPFYPRTKIIISLAGFFGIVVALLYIYLEKAFRNQGEIK